MKNKVQKLAFLTLWAFVAIAGAYGQNSITLTFTGIDNTSYFQLGSINVKNITQGGDTTLYYPDTVLVLTFVGIDDLPGINDGFRLGRNRPNPVAERTSFNVSLPEEGLLDLSVSDILGRRLISSGFMLDRGEHSFEFTPPAAGIYMLTAQWKETSRSIKILSHVTGNNDASRLEYRGSTQDQPLLKRNRSVLGFPFNTGDLLLLIGNAETLESGMWDTPETSKEYTLQFATNIPCPGLDSILYEDQWYHTIQVFSQCWMKENLNAGLMIPGSEDQTDNGIVEKYCYADGQIACDQKGGLYTWEEMMQYTTEEYARGICPEGWHIPGDLEWKILEGAADSHFGIGSPVWDQTDARGIDVGLNLKAVSGWASNGNGVDLYDFTALPGGYWYQGYYEDYSTGGIYWSSTSNVAYQPWYRALVSPSDQMLRMINTYGAIGSSVRCLKD